MGIKSKLAFTIMLFMACVTLSTIATPATAATLPVSYTSTWPYEGSVGDYLYSSYSSKPGTFTVPAVAGKKIKRVYWTDSNGNVLRDATGDWLGKTSYSGTDTISGTKVRVSTSGTHSYGTIYFWDRSGGGSKLWVATSDIAKYRDNATCPETVNRDKWNLPEYPNCTDDGLELTLVKSTAYVTINGEEIPDSYVDPITINPFNVTNNRDLPVENYAHPGEAGLSDPSSTYIGRVQLVPGFKDRVKVGLSLHFGKNSITEGYYRDWTNPGARQIWYYANLSFEMEAYTYRYKDKTLNVEYEDVNPATYSVKHVTETGQSLSLVFPDQNGTLVNGQSYNFSAGSDPAYEYVGHRFTTNGSVPGSSNPLQTGTSYSLNSFNGSFQNLQVHFIYRPAAQAENVTINVRHMVRIGSAGNFTKAAETSQTLAEILPINRTIQPDLSHGTQVGRNVSYTGWSDTLTNGTSIGITMTSSQKTAYVTFFYQQSPTVTANFDITPDTIEFRDPFLLKPKDYQLNGCTYQSHRYKIDREFSYITSWFTSQYGETSYTYSNYPNVIGVGTHTVSIQVQTSCGTTGWLNSKTLTIASPAANRPPEFMIGFVRPSNPTVVLSQAIEGEVLDLVVINNPAIPTPYDPDGDDLEFLGFNLTTGTEFIRTLASRGTYSGAGYHGITMSAIGYHDVTAVMRDTFGASATAWTSITVVPPNPIAVPGCPEYVVENRPVPESLFTSNQSYSPAGRAIDHARDEWAGRSASYSNGTGANITVTVMLHVYDTIGLKSLQPGQCTITVRPDLPPVAALEVPPVGVRGEPALIRNTSHSPDGDEIVAAEYRVKYDRNNNGFADDPWEPLSGTLAGANFTPTKVGKYLFYMKVTEDFGKEGDTGSVSASLLTLDVLNNAPEVSFTMEGDNPQPDLDPYTTVTAAAMLGWPVYETNSTKLVLNKNNLWRVEDGRLVSAEGRNFGSPQQYYYFYNAQYWGTQYNMGIMFDFQNNGYGANGLSPWRAAATTGTSYMLINPATNQFMEMYNGDGYSYVHSKFRSLKNGLVVMSIASPVDYYISSGQGYRHHMHHIFIVDPKKLATSPYELRICNGNQACYYYTQGTPYNKIIKEGRQGNGEIRFSSSEYYNNPNTMGIVDWEIAGRYIYYYQNWWASGRKNNEYVSSQSLYTMTVYDTVKGEVVTERWEKGSWQQGIIQYARGENIVTMQRSSSYNVGNLNLLNSTPAAYDWQLFQEINAQGEVEHEGYTKTPTKIQHSETRSQVNYQPHSWYIDSGTIITAPDGAFYRLEFFRYDHLTRRVDTKVVKYNADFSKAWERYFNRGNAGPNATQVGYSMPDWSSYMVMNTPKNELYVKSYYAGYNNSVNEEILVLNMATGAIKRTVTDPAEIAASFHYYSTDAQTQYHLDWNGNPHPGAGGTATADGYRTVPRSSAANSSACGMNIYKQDGTLSHVMASTCYENQTSFTQYVADGVTVSANKAWFETPGAPRTRQFVNINVGEPTTAPLAITPFTNGQFYSTALLKDVDMKFSLQFEDVGYDRDWAGISFRMQNQRSRYALETDGASLVLASYVNGARTVLQAKPYPLQDGVAYQIRLKFAGSRIQAWLNNIPMLDVEDSTYATGRYGYFSDKAYTTFGSLQYKVAQAQDTWSTEYAIWDSGTATAQVKYGNLTYEDPENDPMAGSYQWSVQHTPRFINNQGLSALHGQRFTSEQLAFDAVGDYMVMLQAWDDPHPDYRHPSDVFADYRQASNAFSKQIIVHRRPISDFSVTAQPDGTLAWTDRSHDPDRYESNTKYSTEATGIDYRATKGIMEKRFYYVAPNGTYAAEKLVTPQLLGTYEIGMAVKDEFGAWSEYTVVYVNVGTVPQPNTPPVAGFTRTPTSTYRGVNVTINSTAYDVEDGGRENLPHTYYVRNVTENGPETIVSHARTSWGTTFSRLGTYAIRQVVEDSKGATAQATLQVTITNRLPSVNITQPASANQNVPTILGELRPTFRWTFADADNDPQARYQVQIYRYGGYLHLDSTELSGNATSWKPIVDLPENMNLYVRVRAYDGFNWGNWSAVKYFRIETNRPPVADFDWSPKPVYEGDIIQLENLSTDPDGDPLTYSWEVTPLGSSGGSTIRSSVMHPRLQGLEPGRYRVKLAVSDGTEQAEAVRELAVIPLTLEADIYHTPQWLVNHQQAGHETVHAPKDFYAGEALVMQARTAAAPVAAVQATLDVAGIDGKRLLTTVALDPSGGMQYEGTMLDSRWVSLTSGIPKGTYRVQFEVLYENGVVKRAEVPIRIIGSVLGAAGVHRVR